MSSFIGHEQGDAIVEKYDQKNLFLMFHKCYYHLHPLIEFERGVVNQRIKDDKSLDIFEMTINTNEPTIELVNKELLIFRHYQLDVIDTKSPLQWWEKHESMFSTIVFVLAKS